MQAEGWVRRRIYIHAYMMHAPHGARTYEPAGLPSISMSKKVSAVTLSRSAADADGPPPCAPWIRQRQWQWHASEELHAGLLVRWIVGGATNIQRMTNGTEHRTWASASVAAARARHRHVAADELRGAIVAAAGSLVPPSSIVAGGPASLSLSLSSLLFLQEALQRHVRPLDPYKGGGPALADRWGRGRNNDGPTNYRRHATHVGDSRNCLSLCCCLQIDAAALLDLGHAQRQAHPKHHKLARMLPQPRQGDKNILLNSQTS